MAPTAPSGGLELLDRHECLVLLSSRSFGRIGVTFGALPAVLPVNYRLIGQQIVFRTGQGTKLDAATCNSIVAFEVDDIDPLNHAGWSVMAVGEARKVTDQAEAAALEAVGIPHWADTATPATVVIDTTMLTGRRVGLPVGV
jgi:nitroimidazol reductase NimA-like FMN-containing flavoprotein (pyridoxamine 5'-phosphate oxidase superfamily)